MTGTDQHVVKRGDGWAVRAEGSDRDSSRHERVGDAIEIAREVARREDSRVLIHAPGESPGSSSADADAPSAPDRRRPEAV